MFSPLYRLPALTILPVNSIIFTILPVNLKPGKSLTLVSGEGVLRPTCQFEAQASDLTVCFGFKHLGQKKQSKPIILDKVFSIKIKKLIRTKFIFQEQVAQELIQSGCFSIRDHYLEEVDRLKAEIDPNKLIREKPTIVGPNTSRPKRKQYRRYFSILYHPENLE